MRATSPRAQLVGVLVVVVIAAACGGGGESPDGSPDATSDRDDDRAGVVECGDLSCETTCCLSADDVAMTACMDTCTDPFRFSFDCDGPEDCGDGPCCGVLGGSSCSPEPMCRDGEVQHCRTDDDCRDGECCVPVEIEGGLRFDVCGDVPGCR
jgi:hypothetical protein